MSLISNKNFILDEENNKDIERDVVTKDTQIAVMGGYPRIETWDTCSTGTHLHFAINTGLYLKDYSSWSSYVSHTLNPRTIVNFPSGGSYFYDRTTKY